MALSIRVAKEMTNIQGRSARQFRYEEMWGRHEGYESMISAAWDRHAHAASSIGGTWSCLKNITCDMQRWARTEFGSVQKEIKRLREQLGSAREKIITPGSSLEVRNIEARLHELYEREEIMQKQRSRVDWLQAGDRNTKIFQGRATHRRRKNTIVRLKKADGNFCTSDDDMRSMAKKFYENLYSSEGAANIEKILEHIPPRNYQ